MINLRRFWVDAFKWVVLFALGAFSTAILFWLGSIGFFK